MGFRVKRRPAQVAATLENVSGVSSRQTRRIMRDTAFRIRDVARLMAPFRTGWLEGSINVFEERSSSSFKRFIIQADAPHAGWMHEGFGNTDYKLGKGSLAKQQNVPYKVGRRYLTRAMHLIMQRDNVKQRFADAVVKAFRRRR